MRCAMSSTFPPQLSNWRIGPALAGAVVLAAACQTPSLQATPEQLELFVGEYRSSQEGRASLVIGPDLNFEYVQASHVGHIRDVRRRGKLRITDKTRARAGQLRLRWVGPNVVKVATPHGADYVAAGDGRLDLRQGTVLLLTRRPQ